MNLRTLTFIGWGLLCVTISGAVLYGLWWLLTTWAAATAKVLNAGMTHAWTLPEAVLVLGLLYLFFFRKSND